MGPKHGGAERVSRDMLQESEDTLRRADSLLGELRATAGPGDGAHAASLVDYLRRHGGAPLPLTLMRAYAEITSALEALRRYRGALERTTLERVHRTRDKLREVSSATEVAATSLLDGLDRAVSLVDRLDDIGASDGRTDDGAATSVRAQLRDQLFELMSCMQFQDITSQQLQHAASVLAEVEQRLIGVAALFDATASADAHSGEAAASATFDPAASLFEADTRQAVADDIFTGR